MHWKSTALWPDSVKLGCTPNESTDTHPSKDAAQAACQRLRIEGFGGERKVFPISVRVSAVPLTGDEIRALVKDGRAYYCRACQGGGADNDGEAYINAPCPDCGGTGITDDEGRHCDLVSQDS